MCRPLVAGSGSGAKVARPVFRQFVEHEGGERKDGQVSLRSVGSAARAVSQEGSSFREEAFRLKPTSREGANSARVGAAGRGPSQVGHCWHPEVEGARTLEGPRGQQCG